MIVVDIANSSKLVQKSRIICKINKGKRSEFEDNTTQVQQLLLSAIQSHGAL